ncbi:LOW QUALITY PROTEIN: exocyst complex component EXO70A1 [Daucus carota subsp. sativus]|uniref:LOW QUALITY PROTEIN: exocyst complex component EXO70A1 n=1 Tax=Daucus carota subsp. sativus TaxID=79200 RepID=UPI0007B179CD|nr:PREDICTED: exocyst complex component EXO70A1 [Daucus carota subsp. sativus]
MAATTVEGEDRVLAAAQQIVKSLNTSKASTDDMLLIFSSFDNRLSNITSLISDPRGSNSRVDDRFEEAEKVILRWDSGGERKGDGDQNRWEDNLTEYFDAVDEVIQLTEELAIGENGNDSEIADRAESALQLAMSKLEDELRHILIQNTVTPDSEKLHGSIRRGSMSLSSMSFADGGGVGGGGGDADGESVGFGSFGEEDRGSEYGHERGASLGDLSFDVIEPECVELLKEIADRMIRSGYEKECCQVYSSVRRDVLDEYMSVLGVERLSIEEVQRIDWNSLDEKMKKWVQAIKIMTRVLLAGEKRLCDEVFSESELIREVCFIETAKGCVMQLLNFGEAVVIARRTSEKLFRILDMYDALAEVAPELEVLFGDESGELVCMEVKGVLTGLGEAAIGTFAEFENAVKGETSKKPIQGGEIHPMCRYVMNYVKLLVDYSDSLNGILENFEGESGHSNSDDGNSESMTPIAQRLLSLLTTLESNLEEKSKLYEDNAMQYIFLMNNILYIVQKVKDSEIRTILGDQWVRKRRGQIRQYATSYLRAAWSKVLSCLKDEGIGNSASNASKMALKERFKNFNACFEDIYRIQTAWKVPDAQLREELRISISEKVLPAYRSFMGRFGSQLESGRHAGKYIKYNPEDLENYLLDLFEGTPAILNHMRRKGT